MTNIGYLILILIGLPLFLTAYRLLPVRGQKPAIIIGSLFYYLIFSEFKLVGLGFLFVSLLINYAGVALICGFREKKTGLILTWLFSLINIAGLVYSKLFEISIVGISFYTFTVLALLIDAYRNKNLKIKKPIDYFVYMVAFPKLVMGPITRYSELSGELEELDNAHGLSSIKLRHGLKLFISGLGMKVIIADQLGTMWNSICVSGVLGISCPTAWLGALAYSMELYLDFWGYSLIAVGLGKMLGLELPYNFNEPYVSRTVGEFWRRWHITLGTWFRDYIYIPLGGSREGSLKTVLNLLIVWLITGLWHGIDINFVIWGCTLGILIILEKTTPLGKMGETKIAGHIYLIFVMLFSWMIFAHANVLDLWIYLKCMFGIYSEGANPAGGQFIRYIREYWYFLLTALFIISPLGKMLNEKIMKQKWANIIYLLIFWIAIYLLHSTTSNPFMYAAF